MFHLFCIRRDFQNCSSDELSIFLTIITSILSWKQSDTGVVRLFPMDRHICVIQNCSSGAPSTLCSHKTDSICTRFDFQNYSSGGLPTFPRSHECHQLFFHQFRKSSAVLSTRQLCLYNTCYPSTLFWRTMHARTRNKPRILERSQRNLPGGRNHAPLLEAISKQEQLRLNG